MTNEHNPYQPPASHVGDHASPEAEQQVLAGKGRRFGTVVVDYFGFMLFGGAFGVILGLVGGQAGVALITKTPQTLFGCVMVFAYYMVFEGIWGRTPGKWLFGTRVVDEQGQPPRPAQIAGRTLCRFIPFEPFSLLFGERGWHDSISKTHVVRVSSK